MKFFSTLAFLAIAGSLFGQQTIDLTEDLVLTETLVISENTTYNGNGFAISCQGCDPAILVTDGARVHFEDVRFPRVYESWLRVRGGQMADVTWDSPSMRGFIRTNEE